MALLTRWGSRSRAILHFRADDCRTTALTGHSGTFVRASAGTAVDSNGVTYTAGQYVPCWQWTGGAPGLLIRPADSPRTVESLTFTVPGQIVAHSGYIRFVERGTAGIASARLLHWGASDNTDPRLLIYSSSSRYTVGYDPGTTQTTSQMGVGTTPTAGQLVEIFWRLASNGSVQIRQSIDGAATVEATASGANGQPPPVTASATTVWVGSRGSSDTGNAEFQVVKIWPDPDTTDDELRSAF